MKQFRGSRYYVTEEGEIFKYIPKYEYFRNGKLHDSKPERWYKMKPSLNNKGYMNLNLQCPSILTDNKKSFNIEQHRMVAELYVDGWFEGAEVDHIDCNKQNNHPSNLQWCTKEYNVLKGNNPTYPLFSEVCSTQQ